MKTMTRIFMCLLLMGIFTATTGCDEIYTDYGWSDGYYEGDSSSGTFFSDYGGSVSWW